jgi:hypothetical protein
MTLQFADAADSFFASAAQSRVQDATGAEEHASSSRYRDRGSVRVLTSAYKEKGFYDRH